MVIQNISSDNKTTDITFTVKREDLKRRQTEDRSKKFYRTADGGNYLKDKDDRKS